MTMRLPVLRGAGFPTRRLARLLLDRGVVRIVLMRGTVHLVTATDCLTLRPILQPMLERGLRHSYGEPLLRLDLDDVAAFGRRLVEEKPRGTTELGRLLLDQWPDRDRSALLATVRTHLPLVQVRSLHAAPDHNVSTASLSDRDPQNGIRRNVGNRHRACCPP
jgi:hypothetical protein